MKEAGDEWDCVQDEARARSPNPKRLPGDLKEIPAEAEPAAVSETTAVPRLLPLLELRDQVPGPAPSGNLEVGEPQQDQQLAEVVGTQSLLTIPTDHFAVQLIAMANQGLVDEFLLEHPLDAPINVTLAHEGEIYHVVLLGIYASYPAAEAAVASRPQSVIDIEPWIRPMNSVQSAIREADALASVEQ